MQINNLIKVRLSTGIYSFYKQFLIFPSLFQFTIKLKQKQETEESGNSLGNHFEELCFTNRYTLISAFKTG